MCILVVEHYPPLARALQRGLEEEGIPTQVACDDVEADVRIRATPFAAVLINWSVPQRGGVALIRTWRQNGLTTPVLLFVPSASEADRCLATAAGADEILALPFSFGDLLARVRPWTSALNPMRKEQA